MVEHYASEEEQIEAIKRWWRENGRSVIAGVVIAVLGVVGWQQWQAYQQQKAETASAQYRGFLEQIRSDQTEGGVVRGRALIEEYPDSPYALLTAFWLADHFVASDQVEAAVSQLRWAVQGADSEAFRQLARLRLGRVLIGQEQYAEAAEVLQPVPAGGFASLYRELLGDLHAAQGERAAAVSAYEEALAADDLSGQRRQLIELKLNDLGTGEPVS